MTEMTSAQIQSIIPHRYPFLLVDRIVELEQGRRAVGIKCVTINELFFQGHFPERPVMPGVLIAEALAQVGGIAVLASSGSARRLPLLSGLDGFRFRRQVSPGDVLRLDVTLKHVRANAGRGHGIATVDGETAAEGEITFVLTSEDSR